MTPPLTTIQQQLIDAADQGLPARLSSSIAVNALLHLDQLLLTNTLEQHGETLCGILHQLALGPHYDHLEGGFYRSFSNSTWQQHYRHIVDNSLLTELYARAASIFKSPLYAQVALDCASWLWQQLTDATYATYTTGVASEPLAPHWSTEQLAQCVGPEEQHLAAHYFVWEESPDNPDTFFPLKRSEDPLHTLAEKSGLHPRQIPILIENMRLAMRQHRARYLQAMPNDSLAGHTAQEQEQLNCYMAKACYSTRLLPHSQNFEDKAQSRLQADCLALLQAPGDDRHRQPAVHVVHLLHLLEQSQSTFSRKRYHQVESLLLVFESAPHWRTVTEQDIPLLVELERQLKGWVKLFPASNGTRCCHLLNTILSTHWQGHDIPINHADSLLTTSPDCSVIRGDILALLQNRQEQGAEYCPTHYRYYIDVSDNHNALFSGQASGQNLTVYTL